ncbi:MAG: hypothetical protein A2Y69_12690 [Candidatus Aminicenantes bacterium RBG_13_59_9]|nr:MAG: hypothetical protein A2Y69_12690 [Candidatus Aminicenantes bacterium RBG_13_59_9]
MLVDDRRLEEAQSLHGDDIIRLERFKRTAFLGLSPLRRAPVSAGSELAIGKTTIFPLPNRPARSTNRLIMLSGRSPPPMMKSVPLAPENEGATMTARREKTTGRIFFISSSEAPILSYSPPR